LGSRFLGIKRKQAYAAEARIPAVEALPEASGRDQLQL
jgi:hypothetical protein